jgi:RimJ/RimL family protein N-acetyltransferase
MTGAKVAVRRLHAADLPRLHRWMNEPHLFPYYMRAATSLHDVTNKFTPRLAADHPTKCLIASADGTPFGYAQWYLNRSYPDYGIATLGRPDGVSIDYFIGDPTFLGRGLGARMLVALVDGAAPGLDAPDRIFHIGHDIQNAAAMACTSRARFTDAGRFIDGGKACRLFIRDERLDFPV